MLCNVELQFSYSGPGCRYGCYTAQRRVDILIQNSANSCSADVSIPVRLSIISYRTGRAADSTAQLRLTMAGFTRFAVRSEATGSSLDIVLLHPHSSLDLAGTVPSH